MDTLKIEQNTLRHKNSFGVKGNAPILRWPFLRPKALFLFLFCLFCVARLGEYSFLLGSPQGLPEERVLASARDLPQAKT